MPWKLDQTAEEIHAEVATHWDLSGELPEPAEVRCGCGSSEFWLERLEYFEWPKTEHHRIYYRCNVEMKCVHCSRWHRHGIALRPEAYEHLSAHRTDWREVYKQRLDEPGRDGCGH